MISVKDVLSMKSIEHQKEILGKWLDGEQVGSEFSLWAADKPEGIEDYGDSIYGNILKSFIRDLQKSLVCDIVTHGKLAPVDDPLIEEFFTRRANGTLWEPTV